MSKIPHDILVNAGHWADLQADGSLVLLDPGTGQQARADQPYRWIAEDEVRGAGVERLPSLQLRRVTVGLGAHEEWEHLGPADEFEEAVRTHDAFGVELGHSTPAELVAMRQGTEKSDSRFDDRWIGAVNLHDKPAFSMEAAIPATYQSLDELTVDGLLHRLVTSGFELDIIDPNISPENRKRNLGAFLGMCAAREWGWVSLTGVEAGVLADQGRIPKVGAALLEWGGNFHRDYLRKLTSKVGEGIVVPYESPLPSSHQSFIDRSVQAIADRHIPADRLNDLMSSL